MSSVWGGSPCARACARAPSASWRRRRAPSVRSVTEPVRPDPRNLPGSPPGPVYRSPRLKRVRIDSLLSQRGLFPSRSRAAASVIAGDVLLLPERRRVHKPGELVPDDVELEIAERPQFASRGGIKLANALDHLGLDVRGRDRKSTRLNSSHLVISYAVFCLKKKKKYI